MTHFDPIRPMYLVRQGIKGAEMFDHLPHGVTPLMAHSYATLKLHIAQQYDWLAQRVLIDFTADDPYSDSKSLFNDLDTGKQMRVFTGGVLPWDHPLAERTHLNRIYNELFRAVHDYFGHYLPRNSFSWVGEERAFQAHAGMLPKAAHMALACETRWQNMWMMFGPHVAHKDDPAKSLLVAPMSERPFAPQKVVQLPPQWAEMEIIGEW